MPAKSTVRQAFKTIGSWYWRARANAPIASQRWHRDEEDIKLVKVFLYLNDIDEDSGPFAYLQYSHGGGKWRDVFPPVPPRGSLKMPPNEDVYIPKEDVRVCTGRAGTIMFCDTSGSIGEGSRIWVNA